MNTYTTIHAETPAANTVGSDPYPLAHSKDGAAHLLQRQSDGRIFLYLAATADPQQYHAWADAELAKLGDRDA